MPPPAQDPSRQPRRLPGQSTRERLWINHAPRFSYVFGAAVGATAGASATWIGYIRGIDTVTVIASTAFAAILLLWAFIEILRFKKLMHRHTMGSIGEMRVADLLDDLKRDGYRVLHDQPAPGIGNIDHILIGPGGVFAIETKHRSKRSKHDKVIYDGKELTIAGRVPDRDPTAQASGGARFIATRIREGLDMRIVVQPVVVFPDWWVEAPDDAAVWVMNPKQIFRRVRNATTALDRQQIALIRDLLDRDARA